MKRARSLFLLPALVLLAGAGCGGGDDVGRLYEVSGTLTLDGKPLPGALLSFAPDAENKPGTLGTAESGPDGAFSARYRERIGLAPGKYKILVTPGLGSGGAGKGKSLEDLAKETGAAPKGAGPDQSRYQDVKRTPFSVEVKDTPKTGIKLEMKSSG